MYIDMDGVKSGPDESGGRVLGVEFGWPVTEGGSFTLNVTADHRGPAPERAVLILALAEVVEMASYGIAMLMMHAEGLGMQIDELEDAIERQEEELEGYGDPDGYDCGTCPDEGQCPSCAVEAQADLAREQEKLAGMRRELESLTGKLSADEDTAIKVGKKMADVALFGVGETGVTPPVTERLCACGCGRPIPSPRPEAKYATAACRVRAHRAREAS